MATYTNFETVLKPVSKGTKVKYIVTTPHGEITRTSSNQYTAIAYCVRDNKIQAVSFASTLQNAAKAATQWKSGNVYYGELQA